MKRSVIQIANSTQLISLPRKWTLQFGIKKGDELEIEEKGNKLEIRTEKVPALSEVTLYISGLDRTSTMLYIRSAYRRGFDSIKIKFSKPSTPHYRIKEDVSYISIINTEVNRLVGLEVIKQTENYCELKDFSGDYGKDFESLMRKVFLQINDGMSDLLKGLTNKDIELLKTIEEKHDAITKFISYCLRLLNKKSNYEISKSHTLYYTLASLDVVTDAIKYAAREIIKYNKRFKKESIALCELIQKFILIYYNLFYSFELKKMNDLIRIRNEILIKTETVAKNIPTRELLIINDLKQITEILKDLGEARIEMEYKQE